MRFKISLLSYEVNLDWIEATLLNIRECLHMESCPEHNDECEYGDFIKAVMNN